MPRSARVAPGGVIFHCGKDEPVAHLPLPRKTKEASAARKRNGTKGRWMKYVLIPFSFPYPLFFSDSNRNMTTDGDIAGAAVEVIDTHDSEPPDPLRFFCSRQCGCSISGFGGIGGSGGTTSGSNTREPFGLAREVTWTNWSLALTTEMHNLEYIRPPLDFK